MNNNYLSKTTINTDEYNITTKYSQENIQIICPWCFNLTNIAEDFEEECKVCSRFIRANDMEVEDEID